MKATLLDSIANNCEKTEEMNRRHRQIIDAKEEVNVYCLYCVSNNSSLGAAAVLLMNIHT